METEEFLAGEKICLNCGEKFKSGRADKVYCSQECKTDYNNKQKREQVKSELEKTGVDIIAKWQSEIPDFMEIKMKLVPELQAVIDVLFKNRDLLSDLCTEDQAGHIKMRDLEKKGFNPHFMTSQDNPNKNGHVYRFCFEYGYRVDPDGTAVVICRPREIETY